MKINSTLVIDDNLGDRVLIERVLKTQNPEMLVDHASNYYSAFDFHKMAPYDLLIIDLNMPGRVDQSPNVLKWVSSNYAPF